MAKGDAVLQPMRKQAPSVKGEETTPSRIGYLPGLDGLRALAVMAVLFYHADLGWLRGGFLGVEIFFVISGYLITSLLLGEWQARGRIDLKNFWLRRARRLLPALFVLLAAVLAYSVLFLPDEVAGLRSATAAAAVYVTNWFLILSQQPYFEAVGRPSLLLHLWSLAVEEQFYLLWPLLLTLLLSLFKPRRALFFVLAGAIASAVWIALLYRPDTDPSRVYYGTDTRAAGLLIGAAVAFLWTPWRAKPKEKSAKKKKRPVHRWDLDLAGLAGLGVLLWACWRINEYEPLLYQGGFTIVGLATAVVIAAAVHPHSRWGSILGREPLRWIGVRSYGIYLWHWPICMITRPQLDVDLPGLPLLALRFAATLILAGLSYRFIETPIRSGGLGRAWNNLRQSRGRQRWGLGLQWAGSTSALLLFSFLLGQAVMRAQVPAPPAYLSMEGQETPTPFQAIQAEEMPPTVGAPVAGEAPTTIVDEEGLTTSSVLASASSAGLVNSAPVNWLAESTPTPTEIPDDMPFKPNPRALTSAAAASPNPTRWLAPTRAPGVPPRVTSIGDSVMLGAANQVQQALGDADVDAAIGRQVSTAIDILETKRDTNDLGAIVVVHLGTNGTFSARQFDQMMSVLADTKRVVFVNVKVPRAWQDLNNQVISDGVKRYPNTVLVDWYAASIDHPDLFWKDGIHLRPDGGRFYADLIAGAVNTP